MGLWDLPTERSTDSLLGYRGVGGPLTHTNKQTTRRIDMGWNDRIEPERLEEVGRTIVAERTEVARARIPAPDR